MRLLPRSLSDYITDNFSKANPWQLALLIRLLYTEKGTRKGLF